MANDNPTELGDKDQHAAPQVEETEVTKVTKAGNVEEESERKKDCGDAEDDEHSPDPYYPPIIYLPEIVVNSGEDGEEEIFKRRAKLYRYAHECSPPEWKERGTGDVKILKKEENHSARIVMRREKTQKVCANHSILAWMDLKPNCGSQKAWVWKTQADYADEEPKQETLAIRFGNVENAKKFFDAFSEMKSYVLKMEAQKIRDEVEVIAPAKVDEKEKEDNEDGNDDSAALSDKMADLVVENS